MHYDDEREKEATQSINQQQKEVHMITNHISLQTAQSVEEAPKYNEEFTAVKLDKCLVVKDGTVQGNPTIDIQMTDQYGNKFVAMVTGNIMESIAQHVRAVKHN